MTNKLIKWEFKSIIKQIGIVWISLPIMAIILTLYQRANSGFDLANSGRLSNIILSILTFTYGGVFLAMIAVTTLIIIMRFYKGLLKEEGYLMNTLPVKTGQLILSKGVVAVIVSIISGIIGAISIFILSSPVVPWSTYYEGLCELFSSPQNVGNAIRVILAILLGAFSKILELYLAMAIGQMSKKHKVLFSVLAYFGIQIIWQTIISIVVTAIPPLDFQTHFWQNFTVERAVNTFVTGLAVQSVLYFIITERTLRKRLNLE